jgi:uncharacterized membrane protein
MDTYLLLKWTHIISSTLLFGTGLGTAFHGWMSHRGGDVRATVAAARSVVLADWLFTAPAVIVQPVTGAAMMWLAGIPVATPWVAVSLVLYVFVGACWLPVVWLQIRMHRLALEALTRNEPLPPLFHRYAKFWFILGWPAFISVLAIFWMMVAKPDLW